MDFQAADLDKQRKEKRTRMGLDKPELIQNNYDKFLESRGNEGVEVVLTSEGNDDMRRASQRAGSFQFNWVRRY